MKRKEIKGLEKIEKKVKCDEYKAKRPWSKSQDKKYKNRVYDGLKRKLGRKEASFLHYWVQLKYFSNSEVNIKILWTIRKYIFDWFRFYDNRELRNHHLKSLQTG